MEGIRKAGFAAVGAVLAVGCSSGANTPGPCETGSLTTGCGDECVVDADCASGLFCERGACSAECVPAQADAFCGAATACLTDGRCAEPATGDAAVPRDAGSSADAASSPTGCGEVRIGGTPVTPNVVLVIDQSSSMAAGFGGAGSRWEVLKDTLLADDGLIADLQDVVRFGVVLYSAENGGSSTPAPPPIGACPALTSVDYELSNLENIRETYGPAEMIEDTPTGDAIDAILDGLLADGSLEPVSLDTTVTDPTVFILATDGEPDTCEALDPQQGQDEAVAAVERAYSLGVRTYVIAVAEEDEISQDHLTDIANAGTGVQPGDPDAPSYRVNDQAGLRDTLLSLVAGEISCEVPIEGRVTASDPCVGRVELNGLPLECNGDDGWRLLDPETVELRGQACEDLKKGSHLEAVFPCDSAIAI